MSDCLFGLKEKANPRFIVIPVPWEGTVSYKTGTSLGPRSVIKASGQIDLWDVEFGSLEHLGVHLEREPFDILQYSQEAITARNLATKDHIKKINAFSKKINEWVLYKCSQLSSKDNMIVLLGGEHSIALSGFQAVARKTKGDYGILQIDAHKDLRKAYQGYTYSHASVFYNLLTSDFAPQKLVQVGIRDFCREEQIFAESLKNKVFVFYDRHLKYSLHTGKTWQSLCRDIVAPLPQNVYISLDIDGLSPLLCPDTSTPVPGGLDFDQLITLFKYLASHRTIVGMDLVEVGGDPKDQQWNGNAAMRILYKMLGFAAISQGWLTSRH